MVSHRKWFIFILLMISPLVNSCDDPPTPTSPWPISQIQKEAYGLALFWENFEDGDMSLGNHWAVGEITQADYNYKEDISGAGGYFLLLDGPQSGGQRHNTGLMVYVGENNIGVEPNHISFQIFAFNYENTRTGYFVLTGLHPSVEHRRNTAIEFYIGENDEFFVNGTGYGEISDYYWHEVEFRNIYWPENDFLLPRFNLYIDGTLLAQCIEFLEPIITIDALEVYNYDNGYTGYDDILMTNLDQSEAVAGCGPAPPEPPPPPPEAGDPSAFIATAKQDAACRGGPANEYPEVDYVEEGFAAPVLGRNEENTWFVVTGPNWGEDCWIWEGLLETTGDINPVPVLPNPPLIVPDGEGDGDSDSESPSACLVQQMNGSTKCVSPCPPNAHPGTPCTP